MKAAVDLMKKAAVLMIKALYVFFRPLKVRDRITIISRQSDKATEDVKMLAEELRRLLPEYEIAVLTKTLKKSNFISYVFHMPVQMKYFATSRAIVLDGYCIICGIIPHKKETAVIQMWHAMAAVKKFGYDSVGKSSGRDAATAKIMGMHRNYDYIIAPSPATSEHFRMAFDADSEKMVTGGLPRTDLLVSGENNEAEIDEIRGGEEREIILYAPTFRRGASADAEGLMKALDSSRYKLVVKLHPLDERYEISEKKYSTYQWLMACDRVITDYSALGVEAALTGKPVYWYVYDIDEYRESTGLNIDPETEMPQASSVNAADLERMMREEYDFDALRKFRDKYIRVTPGECTARLAKFIADKAGAQVK